MKLRHAIEIIIFYAILALLNHFIFPNFPGFVGPATENDNFRPGPRKATRHRAAQHAGTAGHDGDLVFKAK